MQSVIVTGAASGIGLGISRRLVASGWRVFMLGRHENVMQAAASLGSRASGVMADVTDRESVKRAVGRILESVPRIEGLVNNAGVAKLCGFEDTDAALLELQIRTNLIGTWNMTREVIPLMRRQKYGRIVMLSSVTGTLEADPGYAAYGMTKAGLIGLTRAIASEYAQYGITCNAICPGFILTENVKRNAKVTDPSDPDRVLREMGARVPAGRLGTPEEIGSLAAFLLSPDAGYITGTGVVIDGGNRIPETGVMGKL